MKNIINLLGVLLISQSACVYAQDPTTANPPACTPAAKITPICGLHAPEDLELLPDGKHLLVSQLPDHLSSTGGGLAILDIATDKSEPLATSAEYKTGWGDASCTTPLGKLAPHGIHLSKRKDGALQVLAVNHAERESIEALELIPTKSGYTAVWHGCVVNNNDGMHNDVVATPEGGFIATVMLTTELRSRPDAFTAMLSGDNTGYLVEWRPDSGMVKLPNSEAPFNNGVILSKDGQFAYFNAWTGKQVRKYDRKAQRVVKSIDLPFHPDNLTVRADGVLIDAGIDELASWKACIAAHSDFCVTAFSVVALDPKTDTFTPLYHGEAGNIAGASVAFQINQTLYVGSYAGDRLLKIALNK